MLIRICPLNTANAMVAVDSCSKDEMILLAMASTLKSE